MSITKRGLCSWCIQSRNRCTSSQNNLDPGSGPFQHRNSVPPAKHWRDAHDITDVTVPWLEIKLHDFSDPRGVSSAKSSSELSISQSFSPAQEQHKTKFLRWMASYMYVYRSKHPSVWMCPQYLLLWVRQTQSKCIYGLEGNLWFGWIVSRELWALLQNPTKCKLAPVRDPSSSAESCASWANTSKPMLAEFDSLL